MLVVGGKQPPPSPPRPDERGSDKLYTKLSTKYTILYFIGDREYLLLLHKSCSLLLDELDSVFRENISTTLLCTRTMNEGAVCVSLHRITLGARCPDKILPWCCGCFVTPQIKTEETQWMRLVTVAVVVQGQGAGRQGRVTPLVRILMLLEKCGE